MRKFNTRWLMLLHGYMLIMSLPANQVHAIACQVFRVDGVVISLKRCEVSIV